MIGRRLDRLRVMHRDRMIAAAANALFAVLYVVLLEFAGHGDTRIMTAAAILIVVCAASVSAQAVLVQLLLDVLLWVVGLVPADSWWSLPAGIALFAQFGAGQLSVGGSDESAINPQIVRLWVLRSLVVIAVSSVFASLGLLLHRAHVPGSLLLASALLIALAAGLVYLLWRYDLGNTD